MEHKSQKEKILVRTSWVSTIGNLILSVLKIIIGVTAGSLAVLGDGIDSAGDVVISIIMIVTAGIMSRPPNRKYVYGYEKAESIATKILSFVIFYAGAQMIATSVNSMMHQEAKELPALITIYVTLLSIVGKLALALYQYKQGKRSGSAMLMANAVNMRNDVLISVGVILGLGLTYLFRMPVLDTIVGLLIGLYIVKSAFSIFMDSSVELMDGVTDVAVYDKIFSAVEKVPGAYNPHRVRSRQTGGMYVIALDIEVDGKITLNEAHNIANKVEESIHKAIENVYDIIIHVEPKGKSHHAEQFGINRDMM